LDGQKLIDSLVGFQVPIVDGASLMEEPGIVFLRGEQNDVPLLTGGNSYEGSVMPASGISIDEYSAALGDNFEPARELYRDDEADIWLKRMFGDNRYLLAARVLGANMNRVSSDAWLYYTDFVPEEQKGVALGTRHGSDYYYIFMGQQSEIESVRELSNRMRRYWVNFAYTGNPNGEGLVEWPSYEAGSDTWLIFSDEDKPVSGVLKNKLDLLEAMYRLRVGVP
jgi:para-nitrobenzyl esterase